MKLAKARYLLLLLIPLLLNGCQMLGAAGSMMGSLLSFALYLAAIAAPIVLGYYLYSRHIL